MSWKTAYRDSATIRLTISPEPLAALVASVAALIACAVAARAGHAGDSRNPSVKREFQREHRCSSTGLTTGKCPGYIIDHRIALCVGGTDTADSMRWMTFDASILKDRWERRPGWNQKLAQCDALGCFVQ